MPWSTALRMMWIERVVDLLEDLLVEFGLAALDDEVDLLVELLGEVPHRPREGLEDRVRRQHAQRHRLLLQVVHHDTGARDVLAVVLDERVRHSRANRRAASRRRSARSRAPPSGRASHDRRELAAQPQPRRPGLRQLVALRTQLRQALLGLDLRDHRLADEVQQPVDLLGADADRRLRLGLELACRRATPAPGSDLRPPRPTSSAASAASSASSSVVREHLRLRPVPQRLLDGRGARRSRRCVAGAARGHGCSRGVSAASACTAIVASFACSASRSSASSAFSPPFSAR